MVFTCKICGGNLNVTAGDRIIECEYCGTKQTLPKLEDERKVNLYDRASHFRRNNEFDKAMGIYEQILNEDNTDAESYWSLVLCRYGIEYVEDPSTRKRIPTVNRAQFTSIFDDEDYKSALQYATGAQLEVYEQEAAAINEIQKGILAISSQEEPFDVFICYKETDQNGRRTPDSVLATELYHELTREGYKVFFSRITLEDKLGSAYEPYIFAALNSAKVMVVIGTRPEYFGAVWVKNEWSRYLALIKGGARKMLIPAYRDMDPYDLPEEFSHLQAQDMSKLGFMHDLTYGIKKIIGAQADAPVVVQETVVAAAPGNTAPLLKRAFLFLEDGDWASADEYCEKVLDVDPECAEAYLGKLMCEQHVRKQEHLKDAPQPFQVSNNYQKAIRFGDQDMKDTLVGYIQHINERNRKARIEGVYSKATRSMRDAKTEFAFIAAANLFATIPDYADASALEKQCREKAEAARKDGILASGKALMFGERTFRYEDAIIEFKKIPGWKDADVMMADCKEKIEKIKAEETRRKEDLDALIKKIVRIVKIAVPVCVGVVIAILLFTNLAVPAIRYQNAVKAMETQDYETAIEKFTKMGDYKDSPEMVKRNFYLLATQLMDQKRYEEAAMSFDSVGDYENALKLRKECSYRFAKTCVEDGDYQKALGLFRELGDYSDSADWLVQVFQRYSTVISAGVEEAVAIKTDGSALTTDTGSYADSAVGSWTDLTAISTGFEHTVGLKKDGTVVYSGTLSDAAKTAMDGWTDITAVAAGFEHTVALKSDGTVVATGRTKEGQCKVDKWSDIVAISAGCDYTLGLKSDGTVVVAGGGKTKPYKAVSGWTDIVAIAAGEYYAIGLKKDGTLVMVGVQEQYKEEAQKWTDVVAVAAGDDHFVALKKDGTVVKTGPGDNGYTSSLENVVAIAAGDTYTLYLKTDGTVSKTGYKYSVDASSWKDVGVPTGTKK